VVFFHSPADELREHTDELPFEIVADPDKRHYAAYGVETGLRAFRPAAWGTMLRGIAHDLHAVARRTQRAPSMAPTNGRTGLPADFLVSPDGQLLAAKYGSHADDQWSVDELLAQVRTASARGAAAGR
jgi:hypothetical protein